MPYYSKKEFLEQIKKSPLFKNFKHRPDEKTLKKLKFSEENYSPFGLTILQNLYAASLKNNTLEEEKTSLIREKLERAYKEFAKKIMPCLLLIANGKRSSLSLISILCLATEFEKRVMDIRLKYKIDPQKIKKIIYSSFHKDKRGIVANEIECEEKIDPLFWKNCSEKEFSGEVNRIKSVREKINQIISKKYPRLTADIVSIQKRYGLPPQYETYLRDYILFERVSPGDVLPVSDTRNFQEKPEYEFNLSKEDIFTNSLKNSATFRPHISIKIYGSTPADSVYYAVKILYKSNSLHYLPTYNFKKIVPDLSSEVILHKARLYFLHEVQGLKAGEMVKLFHYLGKPVRKNNISRDIRAFKKVFHI